MDIAQIIALAHLKANLAREATQPFGKMNAGYLRRLVKNRHY